MNRANFHLLLPFLSLPFADSNPPRTPSVENKRKTAKQLDFLLFNEPEDEEEPNLDEEELEADLLPAEEEEEVVVVEEEDPSLEEEEEEEVQHHRSIEVVEEEHLRSEASEEEVRTRISGPISSTTSRRRIFSLSCALCSRRRGVRRMRAVWVGRICVRVRRRVWCILR